MRIKIKTVGTLIVSMMFLALFMVPGAKADTISGGTDPAVLFLSSTGQFCGSGGACVVNGEGNPISATGLSIYENGSGHPTLASPLLLIVGIPGGTSGAPTGVTLTTGSGMLGGTDYYGGNWNTSTGFASSLFKSSSTQDVYAFLGMTQGNGSESFTNWSSAEGAEGLNNVTGFGLAIYELTGTGLSGGGSVGLAFSSALPKGSILVAYGSSETDTNNCRLNSGKTYTTPFTQSGVVDAPEPATLALMAIGLLALVLLARRRLPCVD